MNKFYEFKCEYYALIAAKTEEEAKKIYKECVDCEYKDDGKVAEITIDAVKERMSKVYVLDDERVDMDYINRMIKLYQDDEESDLVLVDGSLL